MLENEKQRTSFKKASMCRCAQSRRRRHALQNRAQIWRGLHNDDATKSIEVILDACCAAMAEGLEERKAEKVDMEAAGENAPKGGAGKKKATKARMDKAEEEAINAAKAAAFMKDEEEA